jgi:sphingomyelin phosphodiesterase acid-like 3
MRKIAGIVLILLLGTLIPWISATLGRFWHITDLHWDPDYVIGGDPNHMCHSATEQSQNKAGPFGDYSCDSPESLVKSAFQFMRSEDPNPNFIIWTGDTVPHLNDDQLSPEAVIHIIESVTNWLKDQFPSTPVYPVLGNHDWWPAHQIVEGPNMFYRNFSRIWGQWLPPSAVNTFLTGGFYTVMADENLRLICLNTALYYTGDQKTKDLKDPAGQLAWLRNVLELARSEGTAVYIMGHVAPGWNGKNGWNNMHKHLNTAYLQVLSEYSNIIVAHFYGHEHSDSIRLYYSNYSNPMSPSGFMFLAPSLTPWHSSWDPSYAPNNPGLRKFYYDNTVESGDYAVIDYEQYYTNLPLDNGNNKISWQLEYTFSSNYNVTTVLNANAIAQVFRHLSADDSLFQRYVYYQSVSWNGISICSGKCKKTQLCAIQWADMNQYQKCINSK